MRGLLDINVCIALFDPNHVFHERAHGWWSANHKYGWASCPLTENGIVRIMSNPAYSKEGRFAIRDLVELLRAFVSQTNHEFWPYDLSLRNAEVFDPGAGSQFWTIDRLVPFGSRYPPKRLFSDS